MEWLSKRLQIVFCGRFGIFGQINQDAVRIMKELYGIDMEANGQHSKLIRDIPDVDMAISNGV